MQSGNGMMEGLSTLGLVDSRVNHTSIEVGCRHLMVCVYESKMHYWMARVHPQVSQCSPTSTSTSAPKGLRPTEI